FFPRQLGQFLKCVNNRPLVRGDCMRAHLQSGAYVLNAGLTALQVERTAFEDDIGAGAFQPFANVTRRLWLRHRPMSVEDGERVQPVGIGEPAAATCSNTSEAPSNIVAAAKFGFLGNEQTQKGATNIAEADDREVIRGNRGSPESDCRGVWSRPSTEI